jgi:hypothetical protein
VALLQMRTIAVLLFVLTLACELFAYWGLNTVSGRAAFDEMAGMIPLAVGIVGLPLAILSGWIWWRYGAPSK